MMMIWSMFKLTRVRKFQILSFFSKLRLILPTQVFSILFPALLFCHEMCYLVLDCFVLCYLLIQASILILLLIILRILRSIMTCSDIVRNDIKLAFDTCSATKSCTTTFDSLPVDSHSNIPPYRIQIGMESKVTSYYLGVTKEMKEEKLEPSWVYPEDLEEDDEEEYIPGEDLLIFPEEFDSIPDPQMSVQSFTAYKRVDRKVKPVPGTFPEDARVTRQFPEDPLLSLPYLTPTPPEFIPTTKFTQELMDGLEINTTGFLSSEEEKLFKHVMAINEEALCFAEADRGTFKESYFSPYIIPTVPHVPWEY